jgi:hypothetical protein
MDQFQIKGIGGAVVSGVFDTDNISKLVCSGFGLQRGHKAAGIDPIIKSIRLDQGIPVQNLFEDDSGKVIKEIFDASSKIFVLKEELLPLLTTLLPSVLAEKLVLFSSIFGMEPKMFITKCDNALSAFDTTYSEALTLAVACYLHKALLDSDIFGPWMMHIKG